MRIVEREFLSDVTAHGETHDVGALDGERIQHAERIVGHVAQRIARLGYRTLANAAVVEDDAVIAVCKHRQRAGPKRQVVPRAADQKQRRRRRSVRL